MDRPSVRQRLAYVLIGYLLLLFSSCNASAPASAPSPKALVTFQVPGFSLDSAQWSPDGKRIASVVSTSLPGSVSQIWVWDAKTGNTLSILPLNDPVLPPILSSGHQMANIWVSNPITMS